MFGLRFRRFREQVDAEIGRLLGADVRDEPVRGMLAAVDGLEGRLHLEFEHGCTAVQAAVSTCAVMFACAIELSPELWSQGCAIEHRLVERDAAPCSGLEALMCRFLEQAEIALDAGLIDDRLFTFASTEILGTLEGLDAGARSMNRVAALLPEEPGVSAWG